MKVSKRILWTAAIVLAMLTAGCAGGGTNQGTNDKQAEQTPAGGGISGSIVALGSTALQPLVNEAAKQFMVKNPQAQIQVQGGGSGTGLSQVASGGAQIGNSDIFAEEKSGIDATVLKDHKVAVVGIAAVANKDVGVDNLTKQQLIGIFTGKITNWKEVGGADQKIVLVNRPKSSGTRATFFTYGLDKNEEKEGITEDANGTVKKIISETKGAIGYLAFSYFDDTIKPLSLDGVAPSKENVLDNKFPIWAYEHMYTKGDALDLSKAFLDYMVSEEVQKNLVPQMGYIPVTEMKVERDAKGNITNKQ
ncbi:phosphate ABC transporter substrate-binding protein PstS family protein [Ferviditalea candida]|uniref:Phosphate-binding protein n=1 Tax=Ferviditalea candida TaxID=3108399 RepID=A0ABU5ZDD9_9BACL|nr:phosphate ABC transporter substrate-binding protein PstS family protein [Paenibacillaceae bacterium T2]